MCLFASLKITEEKKSQYQFSPEEATEEAKLVDLFSQQECIPVGCVTLSLPACTAQEGSGPRGRCLFPGGGRLLLGGLLSQHVLRQCPPCEQND